MTRRLFFFLISTCLCSFALGQSNINISITKNSEKLNVPVYRVAILSDNAEMAKLAKRAFSTHGSFIQVPESKAQFVFTFTPAGQNAVKLTIKGASVYEQTCMGSSQVNALMKACDLAVQKTILSPGYFAGKLAFSYSKNGGKTSEICVSDMVFNSVRALTKDASDSLMPHFSPDGRELIYTGYFRSGFMDLFLIDLNNNTRKVFSSFKGSNTGGTFSPDGSKVALILTSSGNAEVWTANASGKGFRRMTSTSATESTPGFSPDGRSLIFASDRRGGPQIYTMPVSGGKMRPVPTNVSRYCSEPAWNPKDPSKIVFTLAQGKGFQVAVYDFNKRTSEVVSSGDSTSGATWLNDGRHIVCTKSRGDSRRLYIIDTATKRQTPLHSESFGSAKEPDFVYAQ